MVILEWEDSHLELVLEVSAVWVVVSVEVSLGHPHLECSHLDKECLNKCNIDLLVCLAKVGHFHLVLVE